MKTREAIKEAVRYFIENDENPSPTTIRCVLNDIVSNHEYDQWWAVKQVKAQLRKVGALKDVALWSIVHEAIKRDQS